MENSGVDLKIFFKKIYKNQWVKCFLRHFEGNHTSKQAIHSDSGFLMLTMVALLLLLGAAYTSVAFISKKQFNWDLNYALGQQYAQISNAAHLYVQAVAYDPDYAAHLQRGVFLTGAGGGGNQVTIAEMIAEGFLPAGFTVNKQKYENLEIRIFADRAPRGGAPNSAPTAFVVIDIDVDVAGGRLRTGSDIAAFRAGAASKGLSRLGIPVLTTTATACNGGTSFVRWGDNPNDCLNQNDLEVISNVAGYAATLDQHDAIAPAWEVKTRSEDTNAVYRYPQPGRPDAQIVNTDIDFDGGGPNNILGSSYIDTDDLTVANQMDVNNQANPNNPNTALGSMTVTDDTNNSVLIGAVTITEDLSTSQAIANNGVDIGSGGASQLNIVTGGLNEGAGHDAVLTVDDGAGTGEIGIVTLLQEQDAGDGLEINVEDNNDLVVTDTITQINGDFYVQSDGTNDGDFQAPASNIDMSGHDITLTGTDASSATAEIIVDDIYIGTDTNFGSVTMGNAGTVRVRENATAEIDCYGLGCPDSVTDASQ